MPKKSNVARKGRMNRVVEGEGGPDYIAHKARRTNIPTAEQEHAVDETPKTVTFTAPNNDQPKMVWRGRDDSEDLIAVTEAPVLFQQERIHPLALMNAMRRSEEIRQDSMRLFKDFNGYPKDASRLEFYRHSENWVNRIIHGDSLRVMASLTEREDLRGQVQMVYFDPPYGIKFKSNWQTEVGKLDADENGVLQSPEAIEAFRDTWGDGIHSYLTYIRDRLLAIKGLLKDSGSVFVQISVVNLHAIGQIMNEVFGPENHVSTIMYKTGGVRSTEMLAAGGTYLLWFAKNKESAKEKFSQLYEELDLAGKLELFSSFAMVEDQNGECRPLTKEEEGDVSLIPENCRLLRRTPVASQRASRTGRSEPFVYKGENIKCGKDAQWAVSHEGLERLYKAGRMVSPPSGKAIARRRYAENVPGRTMTNFWTEQRNPSGKRYVVQTGDDVISRCVLMSTDPGDIVLDPTCGSGTTAAVAEKYGRRWIVIDTSSIAIAVARERLFATTYPSYLLRDSAEGAEMESSRFKNDELKKKGEFGGDVAKGFVYDRVRTVSTKSIAYNEEIDVIWDEFSSRLNPLVAKMPKSARPGHEGKPLEDWEVPIPCPKDWTAGQQKVHAGWLKIRNERRAKMDDSIQRKCTEDTMLVDRPIAATRRVRVSGPFSVESLAPHRSCMTMEDAAEGNAKMPSGASKRDIKAEADQATFREQVREDLKTAGVRTGVKSGGVKFVDVEDAPATCHRVHLIGRYEDKGKIVEVAIMVGSKNQAVGKTEISLAAKEVLKELPLVEWLLVAGRRFDPHAEGSERKIGTLPFVLMRIAEDLETGALTKATSHIFVPIGEPDIDVEENDDGKLVVTLNGISIIDPKSLNVEASTKDQISCWMLDTSYDEEKFCAKHIYFPNPAQSQEDALSKIAKDIRDIDEESVNAIKTLTSMPFDKPEKGECIAVKAINHRGEEVIKVYRWDGKMAHAA